MGLGSSLRGKREAAKLTQDQLAERLGVSKGNISAWENDRHKPELEIFREICKVLGASADDILFGVVNKQLTTEESSPSYRTTIDIPVFAAPASMGLGRPLPDYDAVVSTIHLFPEWVRDNLKSISNAQNLAVLSAYGDSMTPTFSDGDILLVDRGVNDIRIDAVYVIAFRDELFIKRIQRRLDGATVIKSDNPVYDPFVVGDGERERLRVLGRVVWAWNGRKL